MDTKRRPLSHLVKQKSKVCISVYNKIPLVKTLKKYICTHAYTYISGQIDAIIFFYKKKI